MNHYLLLYHLAPDYAERSPAFRAEHLALAWDAAERGELVLAGPVEDPLDRAALLFRGEGPEAAETFARVDPYVANGLVERWHVRRWNTVVGDGAADPTKP